MVKDTPITVNGCNGNTPELIDLKVTDYCEYGCEYCYQSSNQEGKHADIQDILNMAYQMKDAQVLEVAIGGGDPVKHPQFARILEIFRDEGIVPSFSTRDVEWVKDRNIAKSVIENAGAIGFSVDNTWELRRVYNAYNYLEIEYSGKIERKFDRTHTFPRLVIHYIPEAHDVRNIRKMAECMAEHGNSWEDTLLLLGWKSVGRAEGRKPPHTCKSWLNALGKKCASPRISVDTCFAERYKDDMKSISEVLYETEEGRHSMYIDLVDKKFATSSYTKEEGKHELSDTRLRTQLSIEEMFARVRRP